MCRPPRRDRRRRDTRLLHPPHGRERGDAVGPHHLRDDGELLAGRRSRGRGSAASHARVGGQAGGQAEVRRVVDAKDFPWTNSHHIGRDRRAGVLRLKDATPKGVLLGSGKLATELDRLELIDEYKFLVHPRIAGHGPTLYQSGLPSTRRLELVSAKPLRNGAVVMHYRRAR